MGRLLHRLLVGLRTRAAHFAHFLQMLQDPAGKFGDMLLILMVGLVQGQQQPRQARQPAPVRGREIGASIKRLQVRGEKDAHGPAAPAGEGGDHAHIGLIQIRPLLPVHLDADKMFVQDGGDAFIFEGFMGHDVAPVAGGVTDAQKDGFIFPAGLLQGLRPPGIPVHGVVRVLLQIGAGGINEPVGLIDLIHGIFPQGNYSALPPK